MGLDIRILGLPCYYTATGSKFVTALGGATSITQAVTHKKPAICLTFRIIIIYTLIPIFIILPIDLNVSPDPSFLSPPPQTHPRI
jgi:hypothetical protein